MEKRVDLAPVAVAGRNDWELPIAQIMDEYWFFCNMLEGASRRSMDASCCSTEACCRKATADPPSDPPRLERIQEEKAMEEGEGPQRPGRCSLERSCSSAVDLPPPSARNPDESHRNPSSQMRRQRSASRRGSEGMEGRSCSSIKSWKSLGDLEVEEVRGFKELGFVFDKQEVSPSIACIIPGLQERTPEEEERLEGRVSRPYLSEAWASLLQKPESESPKLNWAVDSRSPASADVKKQIKAWARTVASSVRQASC